MSVWERIWDRLGFTERPAEFELLESELGAPGFWGGWKDTPKTPGEPEEQGVPREIEACEARLRLQFRCDINPDVILRRFKLGGRVDALCVYINGMSETQQVNDFILRDGMRANLTENAGRLPEYVMQCVFTASEAEAEPLWDKVCSAVLDGKSAVFLQGEDRAVVMDTRGYEHRGVEPPQNEKVVRGPQEGFAENLRTNITLLRRMIRTKDLVCELRDAGGGNRVKLAILYREGFANVTLVEEVKRRLAAVDTDMLFTAGTLEQLTEARKRTMFPEILSTERPDRTASFLMQGHVAVLVDGSPFANIMPATLYTLMASAEDTYLREPQGTLVRVVRFMGAGISVLLPGYFLSFILYHQGLLSTESLSTIIASRRMVFASAGVELLFLLMVFQLIREAGLRVPGSIGQAIGIIGGLILGQAAINANLASAVILIVVALSGLGNFCIPNYSTQIGASYLRILFVFAAWLAGLLGMACVAVMAMAYMASLKSYGVPFLAPFAPKTYAKHPLVRRGPMQMHDRATDYVNARERDRL